MGYYSKYTLTADAPPGASADIPCPTCGAERTVSVLAELQSIDVAPGISVKSLLDGSAEMMKWYSATADMQRLSARFPMVRFVFLRVGEEHGDQERLTFEGGQVVRRERAALTFVEEKPTRRAPSVCPPCCDWPACDCTSPPGTDQV